MKQQIKVLHTDASPSIRSWLTHQFVFQKLNNPLGYSILIGLSIVIAYMIAMLDLKFGVLILGAILGIPVLGMCLYNPVFAISLILAIGVLVEFMKKHVDAPFGTALDGLLFVAFFGVLIQQAKDRDLSFAKSPISIFVLVWVVYNVLQVLNPWAASRLAWLYTVRSMAGLILVYFIACFAFKDLKSIIFSIKWILGLAFLSALYGLKQEFLGFSNAELAWLYSDPERLQLIFQWSRLRIFSFFSDPTTYGIFMAYMGTFCFVLSTGPFSIRNRILLVIGGVCMFMSMAYAGSRTPFVLVPFGFLVFTLLTLKKEVMIGMACIFMLGTGVMMKSTSSAVMYRIQSAFNPSKSTDTMKVRFENQKLIQPLIHSHPVGVGLGSSGVWGKRFAPDSMLADFAHDSQFVRIAVELGWIGLIIYILFLFTVLRLSIYYYLRVHNPRIKVFYLAFTTIFFQLTLACYPQEVLVILPTSLIFYVACAAIVRLKDFDTPITNSKLPPSHELIFTEINDTSPYYDQNLIDKSLGIKKRNQLQ